MKELQVMTDDKLSVEREIDVYRQLLDENQPAQTTGDVPPAYFVPTYCTPIGYMPKFILFYHISPKYQAHYDTILATYKSWLRC